VIHVHCVFDDKKKVEKCHVYKLYQVAPAALAFTASQAPAALLNFIIFLADLNGFLHILNGLKSRSSRLSENADEERWRLSCWPPEGDLFALCVHLSWRLVRARG
jgi:hypothetical protein